MLLHSHTANVVLLPDNVAVSFTHTTSGSKVPANSGAWTSSNPSVVLRYNKATVLNAYRIVITDARVIGSSVNLAYLSPLSDWPNDAGYTGPSSFTAQ